MDCLNTTCWFGLLLSLECIRDIHVLPSLSPIVSYGALKVQWNVNPEDLKKIAKRRTAWTKFYSL